MNFLEITNQAIRDANSTADDSDLLSLEESESLKRVLLVLIQRLRRSQQAFRYQRSGRLLEDLYLVMATDQERSEFNDIMRRAIAERNAYEVGGQQGLDKLRDKIRRQSINEDAQHAEERLEAATEAEK